MCCSSWSAPSCRCGCHGSTNLRGSTFRSTARLYSKLSTPIPFSCSTDGHDYVQTLSCLGFRQAWLGFERDRIAQVRPIPAKRENVRVHNPLGNAAVLARHLILPVLAVPAY